MKLDDFTLFKLGIFLKDIIKKLKMENISWCLGCVNMGLSLVF